MSRLKGDDLIAYYTEEAYNQSKDKQATTKTIHIDNDTFEKCLIDKPKHYQDSYRKRGYLRSYHKPFFRDLEDGSGKMYCMGIVHIINKDHPDNQTYKHEVSTMYLDNLAWDIEEWVKKGFEVVGIDASRSGYEITFQKNRGLD